MSLQECDLEVTIGEAYPIEADITGYVQVTNNGALIVLRETAIGPITGSNPNFATAYPYKPGSLLVTLNGLAQNPGSNNDYVETGNMTFAFNNNNPVPGDVVAVGYERA